MGEIGIVLYVIIVMHVIVGGPSVVILVSRRVMLYVRVLCARCCK